MISSETDESSTQLSIRVTEESTPLSMTPLPEQPETRPPEGWPEDLPGPEAGLLPRGLPSDAGEVMAKAFNESFHLQGLLPSLKAVTITLLVVTGLICLDSFLPPAAADVLWGMILGVSMLGFLPLGEMLVDQAWRRPAATPYWEPETLKPTVSASTIGTLLLITLPLVLGFLAGMAWFTVLVLPCAAMGIVWLMSGRLGNVLEGFPFVHTLSRRELGAVLLGALLAGFGSTTIGLFLFLGPGLRVGALLAALWSWIFVLRLAGLLARRLFVRIEALRRLDA